MQNRILHTLIMGILGICIFMLLFSAVHSFLRPLMLQGGPSATTSPRPTFTEGSTVPSVSTYPSMPSAPTSPTAPTLPVGVVRGDHGGPVFKAHVDDMIRCYNHQWGSTYIRPLSTWRSFAANRTPCAHTAATRYSFLLEEAMHSWPAIDVYCAGDDNGILEISLSLSEHDWSENYDMIFQKQTICMLSVFYPQLSDWEVAALYVKLRQEAMENEYVAHSAVPVPLEVHVLDGVGCWGYNYSGMIRINIIPVDQSFLSLLSSNHVKISDLREVTHADKK